MDSLLSPDVTSDLDGHGGSRNLCCLKDSLFAHPCSEECAVCTTQWT